MKIDIDIKDNRKFAFVAFLVDRDDFLADIQDVRKNIKLTSIPYILPKYNLLDSEYITKAYKNGQFTINESRMALEEVCVSNKLVNLYHLDKTLGTAVLYAEALSKKYKKNRLYFPVILAAILVGKISEYDFSSTQMLELTSEEIQREIESIDSKEKSVAIMVNRESTSTEVNEVFDFIQKYYFKTKKTDNERLKSVFGDTVDEKLTDLIPNIKRNREWYWLKKEGWSYRRIRSHYFETSKNRITIRGIELAIKRYSDNLK